jgi:putative Mg2+ transporter-C (MgtC) family protein
MLSEQDIILRLGIAAVLGCLVGLERERLDWAAGLRTHMLVCVGSALFMLVSAYGFQDFLRHPEARLDPSRVAAQVVSGIGFLGAGTIIFRRDSIRGLTTAASLWVIAAVGMAVGGGLFLAAGATTFLVLVILAGLKPLERRLFANYQTWTLRLVIDHEASLPDIHAAIDASPITLKEILVERGDSADQSRVEILFERAHQDKVLPLFDKIRNLPGVRSVSYADN